MTDTESQSNVNKPISVLYVDDEQDLLMIGKLYLERSGEFLVDTMISPQIALKSSHTQSYDAIVSDYQMPGMDGITFLKEVREQWGDIPFILFTGRGREEVVIEALNNGADFYLQKGGDPKAQFAELSHKIRRAVNQRKVEVSLQESEHRYRDVVESQTELISRFTPDGTHLFVNEAYCRYYVMGREDLIGHIFIPTIPEEDWNNINHHFASFTMEHPVAEIEHRVILPDGSICWQWWNHHAFFDDTGRIIEFQSVGKDITGRKLAEEALRESEEKFRVLAETAPVAIVVYQDSRYVYVNEYVTQATGYSREELYSKEFWEILHPDVQEQARQMSLARLQGENIPSRYEVKYITKSGETRWADLSAGIIQYGGKPASIILMVGITERKTAEEELRTAYEQLAESEEKLRAQFDALQESLDKIRQSESVYRSIIDNLQGAFYRTDLQGNLILMSPSFAERFGYSSTEELLGKNICENFYYNSSDRDEFLIRLEKNGKVQEERITLKSHDGSPVIVSVSSHLIYDGSGNPAGVEGIIHNMSDTLTAEAALRESEERFRGMAERSSDLIFILDKEMSTTYVSPSARSIIGYDPEELVHKPPDFAAATIFSHSGPDLMNAVQKTMNGELVDNIEIPITRKDGTLVLLDVYAVPIIHHGSVTGAQVSMRNMNATKKIEPEIRG